MKYSLIFQSNEGKKEINSIINKILRSGEISIKGKILQSIEIPCQICKEINFFIILFSKENNDPTQPGKKVHENFLLQFVSVSGK